MLSWQLSLCFSRKQTCSGIVTKGNVVSDKVFCVSLFEES